jgi:hypothetical protein
MGSKKYCLGCSPSQQTGSQIACAFYLHSKYTPVLLCWAKTILVWYELQPVLIFSIGIGFRKKEKPDPEFPVLCVELAPRYMIQKTKNDQNWGINWTSTSRRGLGL